MILLILARTEQLRNDSQVTSVAFNQAPPLRGVVLSLIAPWGLLFGSGPETNVRHAGIGITTAPGAGTVA
jgi:hypothetical protein